MKNKIALMLALVFCAATLLAGCNTLKGMGTDLKELGKKIEESID